MDGNVRLASLAAQRTLSSDRESPAVREESQLDDMRSAIRGDFERLAERRGEQELMRVSDDEPDTLEAEAAGERGGRSTEAVVVRTVRLSLTCR